PTSAAGGYALNPTGQPHSGMIAAPSISLVIYSGEPGGQIGRGSRHRAGAGRRGVTGDPILTFPEVRDPRAEDVIAAGLAAYNKEKFSRVDSQTLDILV